MNTCNRCNRNPEWKPSPLFGDPVCSDCWTAEEEAYISVTEDLSRITRKADKWCTICMSICSAGRRWGKF